MSTPQFRLAHALLLSRFAAPSVPRLDGDARQLSGWTTALRESPEVAIERFKQAKLLVPFTPTDPDELKRALASIYGLTQLKPMLKARGLKLSGRKDELIARLVEADSDALSREVEALGLYCYSEAGAQLASQFGVRKQQAFNAAVDAIKHGEYARAIQQYQAIEDDLGFPKSEFEGPASAELIELVMTVTPSILQGCSAEVMVKLRLVMAVQCLSGRHTPKGLLRDVETGIRLDAETSARMIFFLARHIQDMRKWKGMGITHVRLNAIGGDSCSTCVILNGRAWGIDEAPELPHTLCTHKYGCRCLYQPVLAY